MEYGSDFSIDLGSLQYTDDNVFNFLNAYHAIYFDSGRSATRFLLRSIEHKIVALPDYLCESISDCFPDSDVYYYSVDSQLQITNLESVPWDKIDFFYLLHYFGSLQSEAILEYVKEKKKECGFTILEDTTHSIFTRAVTVGDYCVCSLRKWFPIPDGGVLYSNRTLSTREYEGLSSIQSNRIQGMVLKDLYLSGAVTEKDAFRNILISTEDALDLQEEVFRISTISEHILKCQSVSEVVNTRKQNHAALKNAISDLLPEIVKRDEADVPYIYVTKVDNRNELRSYLTQRAVYCPVHWPLPDSWNSETALRLSEHLISIPIDQRYGSHEVENVAQIVRGYYNE